MAADDHSYHQQQLHNHLNHHNLHHNQYQKQEQLQPQLSLPKQQFRPPRRNSSSLPPRHTSADNSSLAAQLPLSRDTDPHDNSLPSRHNWQAPLKQDGSSLPQMAAAGKNSDLEAAELSQTEGEVGVVKRTFPGEFSTRGLDWKINRKKSVTSGNRSRVCRYCNREFPSGRALGGHMRVHGASFGQSLAAASRKKAHGEGQLTAFIPKAYSSQAVEYTGGNSNFGWKDHNSRSKERRWSGSDFPSSRSLLTESFDDSNLREFEDDEDERSEQGTISSETDYEERDVDGEFSSDDQLLEDPMIPSSHPKEHSLGSLEFISHNELIPNEEFLDDGMVSSDGKRNPLYELRRNPKRSRRFTDQEFALDVLAANPGIAFPAKSSGSLSPERARTCSECGKVFWSCKALFGHMRCHPERDYRGIQPPESSLELERGARIRRKAPAEYSFADNSGLELESDVENKEGRERGASFKIPVEEETSTMKGEDEARNKQETFSKIGEELITGKEGTRRSADSLLGEFTDDWTPRWPTGKRSQRPRPRATSTGLQTASTAEPALTSETTSNELRDQEEDLDMANCLVMLATAANRLEEEDRNIMESTEESAFCDSGRKKRIAADQDSEQDLEEDEADLYDNGNGRDTVDDDALAASSGVKYECSTCKRCFNSHQALGGHRASHRKMKGCFARTNPAEDANESWEENITEEDFVSSELKQWQIPVLEEERSAGVLPSFDVKEKAAASSKKQQFRGHECSICHRIFTSGQALGGHKRCHWTGEKPADTASVASSNKHPSSQLSGGGQTKKVKEDVIDLNLPAPVDEEDEVGYGNTQLAGAQAYARLVDSSRREQMVGCLGYPGRTNFNGLSEDWTVKDLLGSHGDNSWRQPGREVEARSRFDGRPGLWGQHRAAQIPPICAIQHL